MSKDKFRLRFDAIVSERTLADEELKWLEQKYDNWKGNKSELLREIISLAYKYENDVKSEKEELINEFKDIIKNASIDQEDTKDKIPQQITENNTKKFDSILSQLDNI